MAKTKFLFSTDFHGSETVWRKFLNAARIFDLDALVLSGDMTGKLMVPIIKRPDGLYDATLLGEKYILSEGEVPDFEKRCRMITYIPYVTTPEEAARIANDEEYREDLFERMEGEIVKAWLSLIPERVPPRCRVIISPGNDDKLSIDEIIRNDPNPQVIFGEEEVVALDDEHEVLCFGWSNPTPFDSPRECSEEELEERLEAVVARVKKLERAVFCIHVPPYKSLIDEAPEVDKNLNPVRWGRRPRMVPVGSKTVRKIIERYQPLLALHGHIHESPGFAKIGRTQCLNPGSEYGEGILKGFLVELDGPKITQLSRFEA
jgi:Icc-related predicted phosphoesterase